MIGFKIVVKDKDKYIPVIKDYPYFRIGQKSLNSIYWIYSSLIKTQNDFEYLKNYNENLKILMIDVKDKDIIKKFDNKVAVVKSFIPIKEL